MSAKNTKGVRKLERPRPLRLNSDPEKSPSSVLSPSESVTMLIDTNAQCAVTDEDVLKEIEMLHISVNNGNYDATILPLIANVCDLLKLKGASMESSFKDQLDCYFVTLRNASREERLDVVGRLRLLEVIELRAMGWKCNQNLTEYYKRTFAELEGHEFSTYNSSSNQMAFLPQLQVQPQQQQHTMTPIAPATSPPLSLQPTEVLKSSGKFGKPAKIPGRNFLKDEIVIRNSDSGKVMGIKGRRVHMIEELSDTVISFQRGDVLHGVAVCPLTHSLFPHRRLSSSHCRNAAQACTLVLLIPLACHAMLLMKPLACFTAASQPWLGSRQLVD